MKTVTHKCVTIEMDLLESKWIGLFNPSVGGIKHFTKHPSPRVLAVMLASVC